MVKACLYSAFRTGQRVFCKHGMTVKQGSSGQAALDTLQLSDSALQTQNSFGKFQ